MPVSLAGASRHKCVTFDVVGHCTGWPVAKIVGSGRDARTLPGSQRPSSSKSCIQFELPSCAIAPEITGASDSANV